MDKKRESKTKLRRRGYTVHRTVISVERFAIASAGFLVLFASFTFHRSEKGIILYGRVTDVSTHKTVSNLSFSKSQPRLYS